MYYLQDLDFFQDVFFPDLLDKKVPQLFPMVLEGDVSLKLPWWSIVKSSPQNTIVVCQDNDPLFVTFLFRESVTEETKL